MGVGVGELLVHQKEVSEGAVSTGVTVIRQGDSLEEVGRVAGDVS